MFFKPSLEYQMIQEIVESMENDKYSIDIMFCSDWKNVNTFIYLVKRQFAVCEFMNNHATDAVRYHLLNHNPNCPHNTFGIGSVYGMHEIPTGHFFSGFDICTQTSQWIAQSKTNPDEFEPPIIRINPVLEKYWTTPELKKHFLIHGLTNIEKNELTKDLKILQNKYNAGFLQTNELHKMTNLLQSQTKDNEKPNVLNNQLFETSADEKQKTWIYIFNN